MQRPLPCTSDLHPAVEMEGTGLKSKAVKERPDAAVWKGRQVSEGLGLLDGDAGPSGPTHAR